MLRDFKWRREWYDCQVWNRDDTRASDDSLVDRENARENTMIQVLLANGIEGPDEV